jgi:hypothetical protein
MRRWLARAEFFLLAAGAIPGRGDLWRGLCFARDPAIPRDFSLPLPIPAPIPDPWGRVAHSYTYDQGTNGIGHLTSWSDLVGTGSYTFDPLGRMTGETRSINGVQKSMSYSYNLDSSLNTLTYPAARSSPIRRIQRVAISQRSTTEMRLTT